MCLPPLPIPKQDRAGLRRPIGGAVPRFGLSKVRETSFRFSCIVYRVKYQASFVGDRPFQKHDAKVFAYYAKELRSRKFFLVFLII